MLFSHVQFGRHMKETLRSEVGMQSRLAMSWTVNFLYRLSFILGWTVLTAIFVNRIGIESLPYLFVGNAILMMCGSIIFSELVRYIRKEILIISNLLIAAAIIFVSVTFILPRHETAFLITTLIGISLFLGQVHILLQLFIEDMFSPLESEHAFPIIETAEIVGGIGAGLLLTLLGTIIPPYKFLYILVIASLVIIPTIGYFKNKYHDLAPVAVHKKLMGALRHIGKLQRIEESWAEVKKTRFLWGIMAIILLQFIIFNLVEFQYTKAIQQDILNAPEHTLAQETDHGIYLASIEYETQNPEVKAATVSTHEKKLAYTLGIFQLIVNFFALFSHIFVAERVMTKFGIIYSLLLHPILMLANFSVMTLRFNLSTALLSKTGFEVGRAIFQNAYLSTYYSLKEEVREEVKEFIEGIVVPCGALIGTIFILFYEYILKEEGITFALNITMLSFTAVMAGIIYHLQHDYTKISKKALTTISTTVDKLTAIEVLGQKGHDEVIPLLIDTAKNPLEEEIVRIKALHSLASYDDPTILNVVAAGLKCNSQPIQKASVHTLLKFAEHYHQRRDDIFVIHDIFEILTHLFAQELPSETKKDMIKIMAHLSPHDTVSFLQHNIENGSHILKRDCIRALSLFNEPRLLRSLTRLFSSHDTDIRCAAMEALWHTAKYKTLIKRELHALLSKYVLQPQKLIPVLHTIGALNLKGCTSRVRALISHIDEQIHLTALLTLMRLEDEKSIHQLVETLLRSKMHFEAAAEHIDHALLSEHYLHTFMTALQHEVSERIHHLLLENSAATFAELETDTLETLRHFYRVLRKEKEMVQVNEILRARESTPLTRIHNASTV